MHHFVSKIHTITQKAPKKFNCIDFIFDQLSHKIISLRFHIHFKIRSEDMGLVSYLKNNIEHNSVLTSIAHIFHTFPHWKHNEHA